MCVSFIRICSWLTAFHPSLYPKRPVNDLITLFSLTYVSQFPPHELLTSCVSHVNAPFFFVVLQEIKRQTVCGFRSKKNQQPGSKDSTLSWHVSSSCLLIPDLISRTCFPVFLLSSYDTVMIPDVIVLFEREVVYRVRRWTIVKDCACLSLLMNTETHSGRLSLFWIQK